MIKTYKTIKEYAEFHKIDPFTASKRIKNWTAEMIEIPKGTKYCQIDKEAIIAEYINKLNRLWSK